jgi:hypothetical protein
MYSQSECGSDFEDESSDRDSLMKFGPVKGVHDEKQEFGLRLGDRKGGDE